jgi:hydroxylysine kinase
VQVLIILFKKIPANNGIRCTKPVKNLGGHLYSVEQINGGQHIVRLLEFQPGEILYNVKVEPDLCLQSGCYLAEINKVLEGFDHPAYKNHSTIWALDSVPKLVDFLFAVTDEHHQKLAGKVIQSFGERVMPLIGNLPKGILGHHLE